MKIKKPKRYSSSRYLWDTGGRRDEQYWKLLHEENQVFDDTVQTIIDPNPYELADDWEVEENE